MLNSKGQGLSVQTVIIAIIVLVVLVVLIAIFTGFFGGFNEDVDSVGIGGDTNVCERLGGECVVTAGTCTNSRNGNVFSGGNAACREANNDQSSYVCCIVS